MNNKDFDPSKIEKVSINSVEPNGYNPKVKKGENYDKVVDSIRENGLKQFIFVREEDGNPKYVIVDGEQRWTAAKELGYQEIYIYNLGNISEEEAKALTIWFEVQVPFDDISLAPIVVDLSDAGIKTPYNQKDLERFRELTNFDFDDYGEEEPIDNEEFKKFTIKLTQEQLDFVQNKISEVSEREDVNEGRALELLVADGFANFGQ